MYMKRSWLSLDIYTTTFMDPGEGFERAWEAEGQRDADFVELKQWELRKVGGEEG